MAVTALTTNSSALLSAIKKGIDERSIVTWEYDNEGDFTDTAEQYRRKAWLRPYTRDGALVFGILHPKNTELSWDVYGVYHGRFIEMLVKHKFPSTSQVNVPLE